MAATAERVASRAALREAVASVAFDGAGATVGGAPVAATAEGVTLGLYGGWYADIPVAASVPDAGDDARLPERYSAANASREAWDAGWTYERAGADGRAIARRGVTLRGFWPGQWVRADGVPAPATPGTPLRIHHPAEARAQEGFWFAHGAGGPDPERLLLRIYLNAGPRSAVPLVAGLTGALGRLAVPFTLKVADRPALLPRRDSAVLYVEARHFRPAAELVLAVVDGLPDPLGADAPPLTRPLRPGVGLAEDPGGGRSFGMDRCALIAEALLGAREVDADGRLAAVERAFAAHGLDADRPWLASASHPDSYGLADA